MAITWTITERATIDNARAALANRIADLPIWVRWYRTFDNPHGGGPFGKSKEYCTVELVGVTAKRLTVRDGKSTCHVDPKSCYFATRQEAK
jgi:hypothetical protein